MRWGNLTASQANGCKGIAIVHLKAHLCSSGARQSWHLVSETGSPNLQAVISHFNNMATIEKLERI